MEASYHRHDISDEVWTLLEPHLPGQRGQWGGIAQDKNESSDFFEFPPTAFFFSSVAFSAAGPSKAPYPGIILPKAEATTVILLAGIAT